MSFSNFVPIQDLPDPRKEARYEVIDGLDTEVNQILKNDYIQTVRQLTGTEISCMRLSTVLAVSAFGFTGAGSVLAFASGYFRSDYVSFAAGCSNVIAMILMKASYYASSQSHYHDVKLRSHLTKDYRFVHDFIRDPLSLKPVSEPTMPDPLQINGNDLPRLSPAPRTSQPDIRLIPPITHNYRKKTPSFWIRKSLKHRFTSFNSTEPKPLSETVQVSEDPHSAPEVPDEHEMPGAHEVPGAPEVPGESTHLLKVIGQ